jgi:hypothetical protein
LRVSSKNTSKINAFLSFLLSMPSATFRLFFARLGSAPLRLPG